MANRLWFIVYSVWVIVEEYILIIAKKVGMKQSPRQRYTSAILYFVLGMGVGAMTLFAVARLVWHSKFFPGVTVAHVSLSGLTRAQATSLLSERASQYQLHLSYNGSELTSEAGVLAYQIEASLNEAYQFGRTRIGDYLLLMIGRGKNYPLLTQTGQSEAMDTFLSDVAQTVEIPPIAPSLSLDKEKRVVVNNGTDGVVVDQDALTRAIAARAQQLDTTALPIPTTHVAGRLAEAELQALKQRAENLMTKKITLRLDDAQIPLSASELLSFLATQGSETVDVESLATYTQGLATTLNRPPQDARFEFVDGKVKEFAPGKDGVEISTQYAVRSLQEGIEKLLEGTDKEISLEIPVTRIPPKVTTEQVNSLGIKERIGRGESYYAHSIPNRIYNVALASSRINSVLIAPGEEVSFNNMVGEVSAATGYRPAYIIEKGRTVLGDGGGLCQVSTTMFRAAMNAGLPILERWGHAYRVSYYELDSKPGVDATVIAPSKDFRFKNDTPGHILIQTINDPTTKHLIVEIYGTSDGRVAKIENHKVWGITPPLPTIYQDDPTLPAGTLKQVDWAAAGAKASFEYKVVRNGETIQDKTFATNYRPWASVYLRGTGN